MKRGGLALAALLVITGIFRFSASGPANSSSESQVTEGKRKPEKAKKPSKTAEIEQELKQHRFDVTLRDTIADFFGVQSESEDTYDACANPAAVRNELTCHWNVPKEVRPDVQFVIALLPDPKHTNLGLFVDLGTEAIQNAAQDEGFDFDRAVMPWSDSEPPQNGELLDALLREEFESENEKFPGLLIFREGATKFVHADPASPFERGDRKTLFVLVVGEHPTAGINKSQFANAIAIMRAIRGGVPTPTPPLFVLGPTFSGSLYSLNDLLRSTANAKDYRGAFVYSGTIRGTSSSCWFLRNRPTSIEYQSLQDNENDVLSQFDTFVSDTLSLGKNSAVAVLSEDETSYGRSLAISDPDAPPKHGVDSQSNWYVCDVDSTPKNWLQFQFPRGIAQFRSAYQRQFGDTGNSQEAVLQGRSVLHLDMGNANGDDMSPTYSKDELPLAQEAVMLGIVAGLHQRRPRFVVLRATDPLDQLFLAQYLRDHYPEGRLVVVAPDLLFARESDGSLTGLVTIGTYPLVAQQEWFLYHEQNRLREDGSLQRIFENSTTVGTFDASLALLGQLRAFSEIPFCLEETSCSLPISGAKSLPRESYAEYGSPFFATRKPGREASLRPGFWASVLGRDGYWAVQAVQSGPNSSLAGVDGDPRPQGVLTLLIPRAYTVAFVFFVLLMVLHIYLLMEGSVLSRLEALAIYAVVESAAVDASSGVVESATVVASPRAVKSAPVAAVESDALHRSTDHFSDRWRRAVILAMITLTITTALLLLCCVWKSAQPFNLHPLGFNFIFVVPIAGCWVSLVLIWRRHKELGVVKWSAGIAVFLLVVALFPRFWFPGSDFLMVSRRFLYLTSGVSPVPPLLFFALAGLSVLWFELRGMALVDVRRPHLPIGTACEKLSRVGNDQGEKLRELMRPLSVPWPMVAPVILLIPAVVVAMNSEIVRPIQSLEGRAYDYLYSFLLWAAILFFFAAIFRMLVTWAASRNILAGLDRLPLRENFSRLKDFSWGFVWSVGGSTLTESYKFLTRELESVEHLKRALESNRTLFTPVEPAALTTSIKDVSDRYEALHKLFQDISVGQKPVNESNPEKTSTENTPTGKSDWKKHLLEWIKRLLNAGNQDGSEIPKLMKDCGELQEALAGLATLVVKHVLQPIWDLDDAPVASDVPRSMRQVPTNIELVAGEFVSFVYANFFVTVLMRMRSMVMGAIAMYVFILLSISSYPFEPAPAIFALVVLLILVLGGAVGYVYAQMHREATLSRLTDTKEGELGPEFWMQFIAAGALPVLTLLASQFPAISRVLYSLLQPALQSVK
jgi:hypothetical protein